MKLTASILFLTLFCATSRAAETTAVNTRADHLAIGFGVHSYSNNYGVGVTVASPHFLDGIMHVQASGDLAWVQGIRNGATKTTWSPFGLFKLGLFAGHMLPGLPLRVYGGGGLVLLTPGADLASPGAKLGVYGLTGIEIFVRDFQALFVELGGMGTAAKADRLAGVPIYANGFSISWGYKFYL